MFNRHSFLARNLWVHIIVLAVLFVGTTAVSAQSEGFLPKDKSGKVLNLDFEKGTLEDWTAEGSAFIDQPVEGDTVSERRPRDRSRHQGKFWIGGFEKVQDEPLGKLTSASFKVTAPWATFLVGGGQHDETRVELVSKTSGDILFRMVGVNRERMFRVVIDLKKYQGEEIFIRVVDEHKGGWGHINFDNFRFHQKQPGEVTRSHTPLVADEYPFAGLKPQEAAREMKLPEGFSANVFAAEPDVKQPIAMTIDDRGRVWIAEAYEYPQRAPEGKGRDRILIFEDTDGDGKYDVRKVFQEGLNLVSGLEVGFGGVWVGAAPYLMFIPDKNGDDVPDAEPQILLDGWGYHDTHETLNAFVWGPDGWLYGCHGVFTHSKVGKPGTPEEERVKLNAAIWRYHPTRHEFDVFAHGTSNPWGVDFNDHGQAFCTACVIPHLFHIIQGARYNRQAGQHFNQHTYDDIKTIADHRHYVGAWAHVGNGKSDSLGGGHAHAGAMIYLGGVWPDQFRNKIFMNNIHGQRLNMDVLEPEGSGYVGEHGPDFLLTGDQASQMLNLRYGPDGQAYVIDWYDMNACHHRKVDGHDRTNGRIYKVNYGNTKPVLVNLKGKTDQELAKYVLHKNDWYVRHSRRLLQERAADRALNADAVEGLRNVASKHPDETRRLRAMWVLHVTGNLTAEQIQLGLKDQHEYVRAWTVQLQFEKDVNPSDELLNQFVKMAEQDSSPVVRLYLASAAQKLPVEKRWALVEKLVSHAEDVNDHNLPLMYWYAAEPLAELDASRAMDLGLSAGRTIPLVREYMLRRIASDNSSKTLEVFVEGLKKTDEIEVQLTFLTSLAKAYKGQRNVTAPKGWDEVFQQLANSKNNEVRAKALSLGAQFGDQLAVAGLRELAMSDQDADSRQAALVALLAVRDEQVVSILQSLITQPRWSEIALKGLANYENSETAQLIINAYADLLPADKRHAMSTLCARSSFGLSLLRAIENKKIPSTALTADLVRQLQHHKQPELSKKLKDVWGTVAETPEELKKMIVDYKKMISQNKGVPKPDLSLGRAVFAVTCQQCHVLYGQGGKVGPDLTGSNRSNLDYLLSNIVDPSSVMAKEYQPTTIVTDEGRIITGVVKSETDQVVTVQTATEILGVSKESIDDRLLSTKSMMPDNQLKAFSNHQIRSLVAYLRGKKQVPLLATKENVGMLFNGKDLTGWTGEEGVWSVENGEIVGKTTGLKHNSFLLSSMKASNFRLSFEVKLVDDLGNSGVQFRSRPKNLHEVVGYQADIGPGWWGKLYEEHRRGLMWKESGEKHVKKGGWNEYVIEANGRHVKTYINGNLCVDLEDPRGIPDGVFALQVHSGGKTEVRFRKLKLELLD